MPKISSSVHSVNTNLSIEQIEPRRSSRIAKYTQVAATAQESLAGLRKPMANVQTSRDVRHPQLRASILCDPRQPSKASRHATGKAAAVASGDRLDRDRIAPTIVIDPIVCNRNDLPISSTRPVGPEDIAPFLELEETYQALFATRYITHVPDPDRDQFRTIKDVGMDRLLVINTAEDGCDAIGTSGLATCIAICARAKNSVGQTLLGICHSTSVFDPEHSLSAMQWAMQKKGAIEPKMYLVGGMILAEDEAGCLECEKDFLSLHKQYDIVGAKLHLSIGEVDGESGESNGVNAMISADGIFYSSKTLFKSTNGKFSGDGTDLTKIFRAMDTSTKSLSQ